MNLMPSTRMLAAASLALGGASLALALYAARHGAALSLYAL